MNNDNWNIMKEYFLAADKVNWTINEGLIPSNILKLPELIMNKHQNDRFVTPYDVKPMGIHNYYISQKREYLGSISDSYLNRPDYTKDSFYILDYFLVICRGIIDNNIPEIGIIPLESVESIQLDVIVGKEPDGVPKLNVTHKEGDPVKGAIVGAMVAGPVGAVIGAESEKKGTVSFRNIKTYVIDSYNLKLIINNKQPIIYSGYILTSSHRDKYQEHAIQDNNNVAQLISRAQIEIDLESKRAIVSKYLEDVKKEIEEIEKNEMIRLKNNKREKNKTSGKLSLIIIGVFILILLYMVLSNM